MRIKNIDGINSSFHEWGNASGFKAFPLLVFSSEKCESCFFVETTIYYQPPV